MEHSWKVSNFRSNFYGFGAILQHCLHRFNREFCSRFVLKERKQAFSLFGSSSSGSQSSQGVTDKLKPPKGLRVSTLARLGKLRIHRSSNSKQGEKARQYLAERHAHSLHDNTTQINRPRKSRPRRTAHSEGETLSDEETHETDFKSTVARLKKVSLRRFRVWK